MANSRTPFALSLLLLLAVFPYHHRAAAEVGRKVGGRTPVKNVEDNEKVQELGRYCVGEYNSRLQQLEANATGKLLVFSRVVEAETQVVSGIKYFLKISAATRRGGGPLETFEAVVVVKPWLHSKALIDFTPSQPPATSAK